MAAYWSIHVTRLRPAYPLLIFTIINNEAAAISQIRKSKKGEGSKGSPHSRKNKIKRNILHWNAQIRVDNAFIEAQVHETQPFTN